MADKDYFSAQAKSYARFRPQYPQALFEFLSSQVAAKELVWDCATGNGQVAYPLSQHFKKIIATDLSASQIAEAKQAPNIEYRVATAEASGLEAGSVDLVTVAQAIHWFDLPRFWDEARRVAKPKALIAVWSYGMEQSDEAIHAVVSQYYHETVGAYWPPERKLVEEGYASMAFPFESLPCPALELSAAWSLEETLGYLDSWSATQLYRKAKGQDPLELVKEPLAHVWGEAAQREIRWPLSLRLGRLHS